MTLVSVCRAPQRLLGFPLILLAMMAGSANAQGMGGAGSVIVVTQNSNDIVNRDAFCSLREAVASANSNTAVGGCVAGTGIDTITFAPTITGPVITTTGYTITEGVTIDGAQGTDRAILSGRNQTRMFSVSTTDPVTFTNLSSRDGRATTGGAIFVGPNANVSFVDMDFQTNVATQDGGAVFVALGATATMSGVDFTANRALAGQPGTGGGAIANGGMLTISDGSTFTRNMASVDLGNGGAILNRGPGQLTVDGSAGTIVFSDNRAGRAGGAVETLGAATFSMAEFRNNRASINGGAIHMTGAITVRVSNSSASGNVALKEGGALWNSSTGTLIVDTVDFSGNRARGDDADQGGGGVFSDGGATTVTGSTFSGNLATGASGSGGGIQTVAGATLIVSTSTFANNTANRAGGAIEVAGGSALLTSNVFQANFAGLAPGNGGAVHGGGTVVLTINGGDATGNRATEGGAYWISRPGQMIITGGTMMNNIARGDDSDQGGGAVYSDGGSVTITDATLDGNMARGTSGSGGGILINGGSLVIGGTTAITANQAQRAGGGIELNGATFRVDADITGAVVTNNTAGANPGNGGGLHAGGSVGLVIKQGQYSENQAIEGGGIWISAGTSAALEGTTIARNVARGASADQGGGGAYNEGGRFVFADVAFDENKAIGASGSGGGLLNNLGFVQIRGGSFSNNVARRAGGAIEDRAETFPLEPSVTALSVDFVTNRAADAPGNGGALHISGPGDVRIDSSQVRNNNAGSEGGGLWNSGAGRLTVRYSTVLENNAAIDGGGVYQQTGTEGFTMIRESLVQSNTAGVQGGGVFAEGGTMQVINSTLAFNTAARGGGGFATGATVQVSSSTIARNTANLGGGFRSDDTDNPVALDNTILADNTGGPGPNSGAEVSGFFVSRGFNLVESRLGTGIREQQSTDIYDVDPMLGPLADNGGPTLTFSLLAGSPAIDAGWTGLMTDQRGAPREMSAADIGSFEFGATPPGTAELVASQPETAAAPVASIVAGLEMDGPVRLDAAAPNPMRGASRIQFAVREAQAITIDLYDVMGRRVQSLYSGTPETATLVNVEITARDLAAGVYVVVLSGETVRASQQVTVVR